MSNAHKGSSLILSGNAIPVEYSSAYLDFNYDPSGVMYGELLEPNGSPVYSMRPFEGRFGGGIAIEQGTTNLANISDSNWSINQNQYSGTATVTTSSNPNFATSCLFWFSNPPASGSSWEVGQYTHGVATWVTGNAYTWSIYGRRLTNDTINISLRDGSGTNPQGSSINLTGNIGEWVRLENTWTPTITSGGSQFYISGPSLASFELANPQIERKPFSTSFVNGTRANSSLHYDNRIINPNEGTVSFWFNTLDNIPDSYTSLFTIGNYTNPVTQDWFTLYHGSGWSSGNTITFDIANGQTGQGVSLSVTNTFQPYTWYLVTARWKSGSNMRITLYLPNGSKIDNNTTYNITVPTFAKTGNTDLYIGQVWGGGTGWVNGMFSDFVVDKRYLSDDELDARFISNRAVVNPFDKRAYAL